MTRQRQIQRLGEIKEDGDKERLYRLGRAIIAQIQGTLSTDVLTIDAINELARENWGARVVMDKLFALFKLDHVFHHLLSTRKIAYDFLNTLKLTIASRFTEPCSKLCVFNHKSDFLGYDHIDLHHFLRYQYQV